GGSARRLIGCILTKNEEKNIGRAIRSLQLATNRIVVVDSASDDGTRDVARTLGAEVVVRKFDNYSAQRNWALRYIASHYGDAWAFSLDADEWLSDDLASELRSKTPNLGEDADRYLVKRRRRF